MELLRNVVKSLKQNVPLKSHKMLRGARVCVNLCFQRKKRESVVSECE